MEGLFGCVVLGCFCGKGVDSKERGIGDRLVRLIRRVGEGFGFDFDFDFSVSFEVCKLRGACWLGSSVVVLAAFVERCGKLGKAFCSFSISFGAFWRCRWVRLAAGQCGFVRVLFRFLGMAFLPLQVCTSRKGVLRRVLRSSWAYNDIGFFTRSWGLIIFCFFLCW